MVDLEQLCVVAGKIVWSLYVELTCVDDDGAQLDACLLATIAALQNGMLCPNVFLCWPDTKRYFTAKQRACPWCTSMKTLEQPCRR